LYKFCTVSFVNFVIWTNFRTLCNIKEGTQDGNSQFGSPKMAIFWEALLAWPLPERHQAIKKWVGF
jgi:hypothetical protein